MGPRLLLSGILIASLSCSCKAPAYLPEVEEIGMNELGSHIFLEFSGNPDIEGELIAVDAAHLIVLTKEKDKTDIRTIPIAEIKGFKLMYAQPAKYGWSIPGSAVLTVSHGFLAAITTPANIVVTSIVTARGARAFTYNETNISWEDLKMFARFPQGLPPHIKLADIK